MAATKKTSAKSPKQSALKWNRGSERPRDGPKGIKPVSEPMSIQQMGVLLIMHGCRKVLLMDTAHKVAAYGMVLLFGSVLCDFFPLPKNILWQKNGILNKYFAKLSWGWTLTAVGAFVYLTSNVYCCGNKSRIQRHLSRLVIGTLCWYGWTTTFMAIEAATGYCMGSTGGDSALIEIKDLVRDECLERGFRWRGFDVSGHVFLLIYCSLLIHEESKSIKGWERIKDLIRDYDYDEDSPLATLSADELKHLRTSYDQYGVYVKALFVGLTFLSLIWDFQVFGTILYYHSMAQKVAAGMVAIVTWFVTYRVWYVNEQSPGLPGQGLFKFAEAKGTAEGSRRRSIIIARPKITRNGQTVDYEEKTT